MNIVVVDNKVMALKERKIVEQRDLQPVANELENETSEGGFEHHPNAKV